MKTAFKIAMASALALTAAAPAMAQYQTAPQYPPQQYQRDPQDESSSQPAPSYQPTPQYQQQQQQYQQQQQDYDARKDAYDARKDAYDARRDNYEASRADYQAARVDYDRRRAAWERARVDYDARYGFGAYIRVYGPAPAWDVARWGPYDTPPPYATYYGRPTVYLAPDAVACRNDHSARTAGVVIGALAGAALGANLAAPGRHGEDAAIGGVLGAGVGGGIGAASDRYRCDAHGPYYSLNDTIPYREDPRFRDGRYDYAYYQRMHCRLAAAPVEPSGRDYRYVRVCPDADGRFRITG